MHFKGDNLMWYICWPKNQPQNLQIYVSMNNLTSNLSKDHKTRDSSGSATLPIRVQRAIK